MTADLRGEPPLEQSVGKGFRWSLASLAAIRAASFLSGVVLARLLVPEDFGVYAVALAAMNILMTINDLGLIPAVVQWRGRLEDVAATAAALTLGASVVLYAACFLAAPFFARLMGAPQAAGVVRVLTVEILIDGVTAVSVIALIRTFRQDRLSRAELAAVPVTVATTLGLAAAGAGAWSLAIGHLAGNVVTAVFVLRAARMLVRPRLDLVVARRLLAFSLPMTGGFLIEAVLLNIDYVVAGRALGPVQLGLYLLAFNISSWPIGLVREAIRRVSIAGFARLAHNNDLTSGFRRSFTLLIATALPVTLLLGVLAPSVVGWVYGDRWLEAAAPLRFLAVLALVRLALSLAIDAYLGAGRAWLSLRLNAVWALVLVPALVVGVQVGGIEGLAAAHAGVALAVALPLALAGLRRIGLATAPILRSLARPAGAAVISGAVCVALAAVVSRPLPQLVFVGGLTLLLYASMTLPSATLLRGLHLGRWVQSWAE